MSILTLLIPASLFLGFLSLGAFLWMLRHDQFEDPKGQAERILSDRYDDEPAPDVQPAGASREPAASDETARS
ncbi:MAG: cbb3-type cytochrome oxidase assembly protein CcoS [Amaricoccus sp.]|uniref:cbb3-type cytochrome oxidase assembly protein CcoS n=1 Tax=Amaricoccus sp. TaxID=1872485 RepID=UPI00331581B3